MLSVNKVVKLTVLWETDELWTNGTSGVVDPVGCGV